MKRRILVVEDDAHLADGLRINLELEGYEPVLAGSAEDGLELWQGGGIELILLDVMLPGMDGFAFCRRVRNEGDRVPILFLTARSGGQDRIKGLDEGGDDYITKPFDLAELLARIKSLFRRQDWFRGQETPSSLRIGKGEGFQRRAFLKTAVIQAYLFFLAFGEQGALFEETAPCTPAKTFDYVLFL